MVGRGPKRVFESPDSRQILSNMCSLQLRDSWDEAYTAFCELGIGKDFSNIPLRVVGWTPRNAIGQMLVYPLVFMDDPSRELDAVTPCAPIPDARIAIPVSAAGTPNVSTLVLTT
jgi:hypothetical protein